MLTILMLDFEYISYFLCDGGMPNRVGPGPRVGLQGRVAQSPPGVHLPGYRVPEDPGMTAQEGGSRYFRISLRLCIPKSALHEAALVGKIASAASRTRHSL